MDNYENEIYKARYCYYEVKGIKKYIKETNIIDIYIHYYQEKKFKNLLKYEITQYDLKNLIEIENEIKKKIKNKNNELIYKEDELLYFTKYYYSYYYNYYRRNKRKYGIPNSTAREKTYHIANAFILNKLFKYYYIYGNKTNYKEHLINNLLIYQEVLISTHNYYQKSIRPDFLLLINNLIIIIELKNRNYDIYENKNIEYQTISQINYYKNILEQVLKTNQTQDKQKILPLVFYYPTSQKESEYSLKSEYKSTLYKLESFIKENIDLNYQTPTLKELLEKQNNYRYDY